MPNQLPVSRIVNVAVNLSPSAAQGQSLNDLLLLGTSTVIDTVEQLRAYSTLTDVANDFGTSAEEYKAANLWFSQAPQPTRLYIGRWYNAAATGGLRCAALSTANQQLAAWTAVTSGGFKLAKDGGALTNYASLNFSGAANLNAVAAIIQAALTGITVTYNAILKRFEFVSNTTGATSSISFLQAPTAGTDISAMLGGVTGGGGYTYSGAAVETAVACATRYDNQYGQQWYGCVLPSGATADQQAVSAYIEATTNKHLFGITTQDAGTYSSASTTDLAYLLKQTAPKKTVIQYSSSSPYAIMSALARILTTNYGGNNTVITLKFKQEPGVTYESLSTTQADALEAKNCNVFVGFNNNTAIFEQGVCCSGDFVDTIYGCDAFAVQAQTALYNAFYTSTTKIPQTDKGQSLLNTVVEGLCAQYVLNGFLAPGVWNAGGFGQLKQGDFMQKGYYVWADTFANQSVANRAARHAMPIQIAAKLAGAIHDVSLTVNVNQ